MTRLKNKLGEAMKPRKRAELVDTAPTEIESRYQKADHVMAEADPSAVPPPSNDAPFSPPQSGRRLAEGKRVIRDTFSLPPGDYQRIETLRSRARRKDVDVSKSELIRAGLLALESLPVSEFLSVVARVERIKTGRPEQHKTERRKRSA